MKEKNTTVIICCAGMGTRLGIGSTKALVNVCGKPLIAHQLELLRDYADVRIIVGYQAEKVIETVNQYRRDIMFGFNYDYKRTGVAASLCKGLIGTREYVVYMDGDLLVNPDDFRAFLEYEGECIAATAISSDEPIGIHVEEGMVMDFLQGGEYCWPGLAKIKAEKLEPIDTHVYEMLRPLLPLKAVNVRCRTIDTEDDYERAIAWVKQGCLE